MKYFKKTIFCIAASLLLTSAGLAAEKAQAPANDAKAATETKEKASLQKVAKAHFPELSHEFEPVVEGVKVTHDFIIQNKGKAVLDIQKVKTG